MINSELEQLEHIKSKYGHIFEIEENGNLILRRNLGIPSFKLIFIEGGEFLMGDNEKGHRVILSSFYIAEFPVTQQLYNSIVGQNPSKFKGINRPVDRALWYNAIEFCEILNEKLNFFHAPYTIEKDNNDNHNKNSGDNIRWTVNFNTQGIGFRLPTEAEWEYAAKGGAKVFDGGVLQKTYSRSAAQRYAGSDHFNDVGWYSENNKYETKPVGLKFPNSLGIYDLSGNVWEWCWDWFADFNKKKKKNPTGSVSGTVRVLRGGAWDFASDNCKIDLRYSYWPHGTHSSFGFRLVLAL